MFKIYRTWKKNNTQWNNVDIALTPGKTVPIKKHSLSLGDMIIDWQGISIFAHCMEIEHQNDSYQNACDYERVRGFLLWESEMSEYWPHDQVMKHKVYDFFM